MPELPEVNTFQRYFAATALQRRIVGVGVSDDKILRNLSGPEFVKKLTGRSFVDSYRRGKYLFGKLDNGHYLLFHFGMTGDFKYYSEAEDRPPHERFVFHFDNGFRLGFDCPRKFARIVYIEDLPAYIAKIGLGEDALTLTEEDFLKLLSGKTGALKGFLLNQKYLAGVGNLYADEICYQTRVHPASRVDRLPEKVQRAIFQKMREILQYAVDRDAYYKEYPDDWLWQWRKEGKFAPDGKSPVRRTTVAGRTTYYCEGWQRNY